MFKSNFKSLQSINYINKIITKKSNIMQKIILNIIVFNYYYYYYYYYYY